MSGLVEHVTRWENAQLEAIFNEEPQCQSNYHAVPGGPHGGPAAYWQVGPCVHSTGLRCAQIVRAYDPGLLPCGVCGAYAPLADYRFIEL